MATVTDYGLAFTEFAGVLLMLAFLRGMVLHARARLHPAPVVPPVRAPAGLFRSAPAAPPPEARAVVVDIPPPPSPVLVVGTPAVSGHEPELPLSAVVIETRSAHAEETDDGSRFVYWSLVRYRHDNTADGT